MLCSPRRHTAVPDMPPFCAHVCPGGFDLSLVTTRPSGTPVCCLYPNQAAPMALTRRGVPGQGTREYRVHFEYDGHPMSPWCVAPRNGDTRPCVCAQADDAGCAPPRHDIPLHASDGAVNFVCEARPGAMTRHSPPVAVLLSWTCVDRLRSLVSSVASLPPLALALRSPSGRAPSLRSAPARRATR